MEHEHHQNHQHESGEHCDHCANISEEIRDGKLLPAKDNGRTILIASGMLSFAIIAGVSVWAWVTLSSRNAPVDGHAPSQAQAVNAPLNALEESVTPSGGVVLPVTWGSLGQQMVKAGVIDEAQFKALYAQRGGLPQDMLAMLDASNNEQIKMTSQNSGIILNMLWALGLGQNSAVLTAGPMVTNGQAKPSQFASTGGWTLAVGNAMDHYAKHNFFNLTPAQEQLVETVAKNIYRPCCGNSTYFPDCNHGMAMLGLLELMASQGATADQMYQTALAVNSYWFPDTYLTIAKYLQNKGVAWNAVKPQDILSATYSSAQGYQQILSQTQPVQSNQSGGGGCGA